MAIIIFKENIKDIFFTSVLWNIKSQREASICKNKCKATYYLIAIFTAFTITIYSIIWHHCSIISDFLDDFINKKGLFISEMTILALRGLQDESHHYLVLDLTRWTIKQCIASVLRTWPALGKELCSTYMDFASPQK